MANRSRSNGTTALEDIEGVGSQAYLASIVECSDDAIYGKTLDGTILSWNQGAERIYGYAAAEMVGRPVSVLVPPNKPDEVPAILEKVRRGERVSHFETTRVRKDGEVIDLSLNVSPIRDASGQIVGASTTARDITEQKKMREALAQRAKEILDIIEWELVRSGFIESLHAGVVLTGGVSLLPGIRELAERVFDMPVRIGVPCNFGGLGDVVKNPIYSTAAGLLIYGRGHGGGMPMRDSRNKLGSVWETLKRWYREFW